MHTDGCKDVGIGCSQDDSHCSPGRGSNYIDLVTINRPLRCVLPDSLYDVGNPGWFPPITKLMCRFKPVPTEGSVGFAHLLWIRNYEPVPLCQFIHACPSSEVLNRLSTSM